MAVNHPEVSSPEAYPDVGERSLVQNPARHIVTYGQFPEPQVGSVIYIFLARLRDA